jgi:hypothetical protein
MSLCRMAVLNLRLCSGTNPDCGGFRKSTNWAVVHHAALSAKFSGRYALAYGGVSCDGDKHWVQGAEVATVPLQTPGDYWYQAGGQVPGAPR